MPLGSVFEPNAADPNRITIKGHGIHVAALFLDARDSQIPDARDSQKRACPTSNG